MCANTSLNRALNNPNDNFYTFYEDIEKELPHYFGFLRGKSVYCPCDHPDKSNFWKYLHKNFSKIGLTKLSCSFCSEKEKEKEKEFLSVYCGGDDDDIGQYDKVPLSGNGDFMSDECLDVAESHDVVITNPPFSLAARYIEKVTLMGKVVVIVVPETIFGNKFVFRFFVNKTLKVGFNAVRSFMCDDGSIKKFGNIAWVHSIPGIDNVRPLNLTRRYKDMDYQRYVNYPEVINVPRIKDIPADYKGVMGVPITFFKYYDPSKHTVVAIFDGATKDAKLYLDVNGVMHKVYNRILINQSINQ